jgi:hypothetical protein
MEEKKREQSRTEQRKTGCLNVQCSKFFPFPQLIYAKLDFQGTGQQNLNIVTHLM